jgi:DNA-binding transcriptional ArsR family regulator
MGVTEQQGQRRVETICAALKHPMRVRILEVLNEGPRSPSQFVEEGLVPKDLYGSYPQALSLASYHFRELEREGCLEIVESIPRRGALEHVYEGKARVYFTDAEFEQMPREKRRTLSRISFQGLVARADSAMRADTFDARTDRHLTWMPMQLDERGWDELSTALAGCFGEVEQIRHDAKDRLASSGEEAVPVTFGMVGFESPPPPPLPQADPVGG